MSNIDRAFIDQVLASTDIVEVIKEKVDLKKNGTNYKGLCPFHNEKTPSFNVSSTKQFYHCFGCGASGDAIKFLTEYEHLTFIEALSKLAQIANLEVPKFTKDNNKLYNLFMSNKKAAECYSKWLNTNEDAMKYLANRNISSEMIEIFQLGYSNASWDGLKKELQKNKLLENGVEAGLLIKKDNKTYDRFRNRIMFPIKNTTGNIIGFGGRTIDKDEGAKYINSPETKLFHKSYELYGLNENKRFISKEDSVIIVEGYTDVIALHQNNLKNCVATLGTAFTKYHFTKISRYASTLIFCFDGDIAGQKAAWKAVNNLLPELRDELQIKLIFLPEGCDPDSFVRKSREIFTDMISNALPLSEYIINHLKNELQLDTVEGKTQFALRAKEIIKSMPEITYTQILQKALEKISGERLDYSNHKKAENIKKNESRKKDSDIREITLLSLIVEYPELSLEYECENYITDSFLREIYSLIRDKQNKDKTFTGAQLLSIYPNNEIVQQIILHDSNEKSIDSARVTINEIINQLKIASNETRYFEILTRHSEGKSLSEEERKFISTFKK